MATDAVAAVNAVIALYYYARVVQSVWMDPAPDEIAPEPEPAGVAPSLGLAFGILALAVVLVGIFPEAIGQFAQAASSIVGG